MNLPDITPSLELQSLASQTPTQREKAGLEPRLQELLKEQRLAVAAALQEIQSSMAQELSITEANLGWSGKTFQQLQSELDDVDERAGLNDPDSVKSWELADKTLTEQEILKAKVGRLWNKAEVYCSKLTEMLSSAEAWLKRAGYYPTATDASNDSVFFFFRERALFSDADTYRKRLQRIYNRLEQCVIVLQSLAGRKFSATKYAMELPRVDTEGYEIVGKGTL